LERASPEDVGDALDLISSWLQKEPNLALAGLSITLYNSRNTKEHAYTEKCTTAFAVNVGYYFKEKIRYDAIQLQEDNHVNLSFLERGYNNKISYKYAFINLPPKNKATGATGYRTYDTELAACTELQKQHPKYVKVRIKEKLKLSGHSAYDCQVRVGIQWKKAYHDNRS
jgi:hypothetical protein